MKLTRHYMRGELELSCEVANVVAYVPEGRKPDAIPDHNFFIIDNGPGFPGGRFLLILENAQFQSDDLSLLEPRLLDWLAPEFSEPVEVAPEIAGAEVDSFLEQYCAAWGFDLDSTVMQSDDCGAVFAIEFSGGESFTYGDAIANADRGIAYFMGGFAPRLADAFSREIRAVTSPGELAEINHRNAENPAGCATHDFMDANEQMAAAFLATVGREVRPASEHDCAMWNRAWEIARARGFAAGEAD